MPVAGGGFDQCYNAQAAVAAGSLLVVASAVSQAPNDKQQLELMLDKIEALPDALGKPECLLADTGYFSAANVAACEKAGIGGLGHHEWLGLLLDREASGTGQVHLAARLRVAKLRQQGQLLRLLSDRRGTNPLAADTGGA